MEAAPEPSERSLFPASWVFLALCGVALLAATFAGDGSDVDGILPVGGAAWLLLAGVLVVGSFGRPVAPRLDGAGVALVAAMSLLVAWIGVTVAWSITPDRSWEAFNRSLAFLGFLGLGIVLAGVLRRVAARAAAGLLAVVLGATLTWALATKVVPSLDPDGDRVARLREPVDYWNALALLADVAIVLGMWLGSSREHRVWTRVGGGLLVYVATLALALTLSRAGVVAGVAVVLLWLVLSSERVAGALLLLASAVPAALVAGWAFTRPALVEDGAARSDRVADGTWLGVLGGIGAGVVVMLLVVGSRRGLGDSGRRRVTRGLAVAGTLVAVAAVGAVAVAIGSAATSEPSCSELANDPSRLSSVDFTNRWCWWNEAWDVFAANSPEGAGAGSFVVARKRYREDARNVVQPHSVPLQQLADGGVAAVGLFVVLVLAGAWTCVAALRRLDGPEHGAATALVAAPAAYVLHALVDYDWDFLAVTAPTMLALGVLAGAGRPVPARGRRPFVGVAAALVVVAVLVSFSFPRLADRSLRQSTRSLGAGDFDDARSRAIDARLLNPLSVAPLYARARVSERQRFRRSAEAWYVDAVEQQPENPETWYALGLFEFQVRENMCAAYEFLNNAYTLDPKGRQWQEGGPLDVARAAVNRGACKPAG